MGPCSHVTEGKNHQTRRYVVFFFLLSCSKNKTIMQQRSPHCRGFNILPFVVCMYTYIQVQVIIFITCWVLERIQLLTTIWL